MRQLNLQPTAVLFVAALAFPTLVQGGGGNAMCTNAGGACVSTSSCKGEGGLNVSNLCPDSGDDVKCCFYVSQDAGEKCTAKFGAQALGCLSTAYCASQGGSSKAGFCPGTDDIQCCELPMADASSSFVLPTGPPKSSKSGAPATYTYSAGGSGLPTYTMSPATTSSAAYSAGISTGASGAPSPYTNSSVLSTTATLSPPATSSTPSPAASSTGGAWSLGESVRESWVVVPALLAGFAGLFL
jgi:hypothetical protein